MTILQVLEKLSSGDGSLVNFLQDVGTASPDLKPTADAWISSLEGAASQENLMALATALRAEIAQISQGHFDPHEHPSDAV